MKIISEAEKEELMEYVDTEAFVISAASHESWFLREELITSSDLASYDVRYEFAEWDEWLGEMGADPEDPEVPELLLLRNLEPEDVMKIPELLDKAKNGKLAVLTLHAEAPVREMGHGQDKFCAVDAFAFPVSGGVDETDESDYVTWATYSFLIDSTK